jgi:hypothetical protein
MLIHALGQTSQVPLGHIESLFGANDLNETLLGHRNLAASPFAPVAELSEGRTVTLKSHLLGCSIGVTATNERPCVEVAESFLAALESLLATAPVTQLVAREPILDVEIRIADSVATLIEHALEEQNGRPTLAIRSAPFDPHSLTAEQQNQIKNEIISIVMKALGRVFLGDSETVLPRLETEDAIGRAINFTGSFVRVANVLGNKPKDQISHWIDRGRREYALARWRKWDADSLLKSQPADGRQRIEFGSSDSPAELLDQSNPNHRAIRTVSVIREGLWHDAAWVGTGFLTGRDYEMVPVMAPIFKNRAPAEKIFELWREEFGESDENEGLRISIVRGISIKEPHAYRVLVAPGQKSEAILRAGGFDIFVGRTNAMRARDPENLNRFIRSYDKFKTFLFVPATSDDSLGSIELIRGVYLRKKQVFIRAAWEVGQNDLDSPAIHEDDDPIIPEGRSDAPVLSLLKWKRDQKDCSKYSVSG